MKCQHFGVVLAVLALSVLSCASPAWVVPTVTATLPTDTPIKVPTVTATLPTLTATWTAQVSRAQINVRAEPGGDVTKEYLTAGDTVTIIRCISDKEIGDWCKIVKPAGWVFRGCLSDNPNKLGCETRP